MNIASISINACILKINQQFRKERIIELAPSVRRKCESVLMIYYKLQNYS